MHSSDIDGDKIITRTARREDLPVVYELLSQVNLGPAYHAISSCFECDPRGMYVAQTREGQIIGNIAFNKLVYSRRPLTPRMFLVIVIIQLALSL